MTVGEEKREGSQTEVTEKRPWKRPTLMHIRIGRTGTGSDGTSLDDLTNYTLHTASVPGS